MRQSLLLLVPFLLFAKPFSVATYNVENLFDAVYQGSEYKEYIPGKHNWNARMAEIKLNHTAEVICDLNADILALQEVENEQVFQALLKRLKTVGCGYRYGAITHKKGAPIQVALLSRYPIKKEHEIEISYAPRVRNILEAEVAVQGEPLTLFVNHWKSKAYQGVESKRIKYAKALQRRLDKLPKNREYLLLGDFNSDYDASMSLEEKLNDTGGKTGFSDILHTDTSKKEILTAKPGVHYTLWRELDIDERWSHKFFGKTSSPDQIVLPQLLFDKKGIDYVNHSFRVFKAPYLFTKRGYINAWRYKHGKHMAKGYSDHLPVLAYFDIKPYRTDKSTKDSKIIENETIDYLYKIDHSDREIKLEDATVILKRGRHAIIKQKNGTRGIFLYGCAQKLKEFHRYDLLVRSMKSYKGLKEITHLYILKDKGGNDARGYYLSANDLLHKKLVQNEVISDIEGVYKNRFFYTGGTKIPIYFKKKKHIPPNGSKLKLHYAHLGYYKGLQLVVYDTEDFTVSE